MDSRKPFRPTSSSSNTIRSWSPTSSTGARTTFATAAAKAFDWQNLRNELNTSWVVTVAEWSWSRTRGRHSRVMVQALFLLKTCHVEELMLIKSVVACSPHFGEVWNLGEWGQAWVSSSLRDELRDTIPIAHVLPYCGTLKALTHLKWS
ncbi:hypothetical protein TNCV_3440321 [Trichonephila clavipes]|uniref:Uncharacterized protein n=1 Tax=Trichonephila clavipes TaxID=2585209 RepID=A0A8X7BEL8_TRICX|nr:hypothetical protein TNCV_3440321 [Trichonephila clavipes]